MLTLEKKAPTKTTNKKRTFLPITCTGYEMYNREEVVVIMFIANRPPIIIFSFIVISQALYFLDLEITVPAMAQNKQPKATISEG